MSGLSRTALYKNINNLERCEPTTRLVIVPRLLSSEFTLKLACVKQAQLVIITNSQHLNISTKILHKSKHCHCVEDGVHFTG